MSGGQATGDRGAGGTLSRRGQQPLGLAVLQVDPRGKRGTGYRKGERGATGRGLMVTKQGLVSGRGFLALAFPAVQWSQIALVWQAWPGTEGHRAQGASLAFWGRCCRLWPGH